MTEKKSYEIAAAQNSELLESVPSVSPQYSTASSIHPQSQPRLLAAQVNTFYDDCPSSVSGPSTHFTDSKAEKIRACSSVCSEGASNYPDYAARELKSGDGKHVRAKSEHRSRMGVRSCRRVAGKRNLSEKRRKDNINNKLRALQELIPNCTNRDKVVVLDEAIAYIRTLQHQLQGQVISSGNAYARLIYPTMQTLPPPYMAHFSAPGIQIGWGTGIGHFSSMHLVGFPNLTLEYGSRTQRPGLFRQQPLMSTSFSPFVSLAS